MEDCLDSMDTKTKVVCGTITALVVVVTGLIVMSFGSLEPT